jgi:mitochondrial fission protein ELM1
VALAQRFIGLCAREGLRPRISTSPRTPEAVEAAVTEALRDADHREGRGAEGFWWHQAQGAPSPLRRWLGEGKLAVVTGDSMSMILEAMSAGCITAYAALPEPWSLRWESATHRLAQRLAPQRFRRNTRNLLNHWEATGGLWALAALERGPLPTPSAVATALPEASLEAALEALARLMEDERP